MEIASTKWRPNNCGAGADLLRRFASEGAFPVSNAIDAVGDWIVTISFSLNLSVALSLADCQCAERRSASQFSAGKSSLVIIQVNTKTHLYLFCSGERHNQSYLPHIDAKLTFLLILYRTAISNEFSLPPFSFAALLAGTLRTYQKAGCDAEYISLSCPRGTSISIEIAQYGNTLKGKCRFSFRRTSGAAKKIIFSAFLFLAIRRSWNFLTTKEIIRLRTLTRISAEHAARPQ